MGGGPPGMIPPAGTYPAPSPRPFNSMGDTVPAPGRRPSGAGRQPYGPPHGYPPHVNGPEGPGYPGGFNGDTVPRIHTPKPPQTGKSAPLDIGFEAPEPRPKPSKTAPPAGSIAPPPSGSGRPGTSQGSQGGAGKKPQGSQYGSGQGSPDFFRPSNGPPTPPVNTAQAPRPPTAETVSKPTSTPLPKPPGKGPKTFEDMGVPQAPKQEQDCVSGYILQINANKPPLTVSRI